MTSDRRRWLKRAALVLLLTALSVAIVSYVAAPRIGWLAWRVQLVKKKLQGSLVSVSWAETAAAVAGTRSSGPRTHLPIRLKQRAEGACGFRWSTPFGDFWGDSDGDQSLDEVLLEEIRDVYQQPPVTLHRGDVVLDVGAHLGTFTRVALDSGARLVVAFEPDGTNAACLEQSFRSEIDAKRVLLVRAAVWESPGTLRFRHAGGGSSRVASEGQDEGQVTSVVATTIDETVQTLGLDQVNFIKMDIEGAERHAIAGAQQTLSRFRPRMAICIYHRPDDAVEIPRLIREANPSYELRRNPLGQQAFFY